MLGQSSPSSVLTTSPETGGLGTKKKKNPTSNTSASMTLRKAEGSRVLSWLTYSAEAEHLRGGSVV